MNLAGLRAGLTKNKTPLAIGGVVVVGLLAWRARSQSAASASTPAAGTIVTSGTTPLSGYSSGSQTYASSPYSSTASDVYNSLQPTLEQILNNQTKTPIPVPAPPASPASQGFTPGYYRRAGTQAVYNLDQAGNLGWISLPEYKDLGAPAVTAVPINSTLWSAPLIGADAPTQFKTIPTTKP